jgi:shikimate 5-dehydrogenase
MGERGLYSRILAPFLGSELQFVGLHHAAAPGQLLLDDALAIYGDRSVRAGKIFAIVGNPAAHSRSPMIHNPLFRRHGVAAAYTIASFASFAEIAEPFARGDRFAPDGLSVTAPFKEEAFAFAERIGAAVAENARDAGAVNTLVRMRGRVVADNTDVDGFAALLPADVSKAAIVGAGGTARAARVALQRAGIKAILYNRTPKEGALPLDALPHFDGDLVVNTLPGGVDVAMPDDVRCISAAYDARQSGGLALLEAQAVRQNALFLEACHGL